MFFPKPVEPPLPWQMYVKLSKNQGLDVIRLKENYLREQYEFENYISHLNWLSMNQPKGPLPSAAAGEEVGVFGSGYWDDYGNWIDTQNWVD